MSHFDEQPDGDPHGECSAEIDRLKALNAELAAALEALLYWDHSKPEFYAARAALEKQKGETT